MSRSFWAWSKSCAFVSAAGCGVGKLGTDSSLIPTSWVATTVAFMLALSPAGALGKAGSPRGGFSVALATRGASQAHGVTRPTFRNADAPHRRGGSASGQSSPPKLLTVGSGYSDTDGSTAVKAIQRRLDGLGYSPGPIDGRYGRLTRDAVIRFQAAHRLRIDGIAGPLTIEALDTAKLVLAPGDGHVAGGSQQVRRLQRDLAAAGYAPGPIDGRYGPRTEAAVRRLQAARHLEVDGIAGPQTLGDLRTPAARRVHSKPRPVPPPRPRATAHRGSHRAPPRPNRARGRSGRVSPAAHHASHSGGFSSIVWFIVAAVLAAALAAGRWLRRRAGGSGAPTAGELPAPVAPPQNARDAVADGRDRLPHEDLPDPACSTACQKRTDEMLADGGKEDPDMRAAAIMVLASFRLGLLLAEKGDRVEAEDAFQRAAEHGHPRAAYELGILRLQAGDHEGAKDAFRRADERGHPAAAFDLGRLLGAEGHRSAAKPAFRRAVERGHPDAGLDLGVLLLEEGDQSAAEASFRHADQRGNAAAACNLGVLLEQRGELNGARDAYRRADERGLRVGACNLGALLAREGDLAGAREAYRRADQRGDPLAPYQLGLLLERDGDLVGAKETYRRAHQRGNPEAAYRLGFLLQQEGDHAGAQAAFQHAREQGSSPVVDLANAALRELVGSERSER